MPLDEDTIVVEDAIDALLEERRELAAEARGLDSGDDEDAERLGQIEQRRLIIEDYVGGLEWVADQHSPDSEIRVLGLTGGEFGRVEDAVAEDSGGGGSWRVHTVARGVGAAPWLDGAETQEQALAATSALPLSVQKYLYDRIDELSTVGNRDFADWQSLTTTSSDSNSSA